MMLGASLVSALSQLPTVFPLLAGCDHACAASPNNRPVAEPRRVTRSPPGFSRIPTAAARRSPYLKSEERRDPWHGGGDPRSCPTISVSPPFSTTATPSTASHARAQGVRRLPLAVRWCTSRQYWSDTDMRVRPARFMTLGGTIAEPLSEHWLADNPELPVRAVGALPRLPLLLAES